MKTRIEILELGERLPHGTIKEISNNLGIDYSIVRRTLSGGVAKLKKVHQDIANEAERILSNG